MNYGTIPNANSGDGNSSGPIKKSTCTSIAEFLESSAMQWIILIVVTAGMLALMGITIIKFHPDDTSLIGLLSNLIFVINIVFLVEIFLRFIVFGPTYFYNGKYGPLHGLDALVVLATFGLVLFFEDKDKEMVELLLLLRLWRIIKIWNVEGIDYIKKSEPPALHVLFVMDRGGSMGASDITPQKNSRNYNNLRTSHNNRLGAAYDAVYSFMETRLQTFQKNTGTPLIAGRDKVSLILFDDKADVAIDNKNMEINLLFEKMLEYKATKGRSDYNVAINKVDELVTKNFDVTRLNVVIFFSDGEVELSEFNNLDSICKRNAEKSFPLYFYTVHFGPDTGSDTLEMMSNVAKSYNPQGPLSSQFTIVMDEVMLNNLLIRMAIALRDLNAAMREIRWWIVQLTLFAHTLIDDPLDEHLTPYKRERNERIPVALKRLHNSKSVSKEFLDELKAHHRCATYGMRFLKCYGISRHPEKNDLVMVMQFAKGGNLRRYLQKNPDLDWQKKLDILHFIVHDLEALHNAGLVHRDFHSGNVIMRGTWAYLSDLGLSSPVKRDVSKEVIYGIMQYIAPEVLRGKHYTPEADIYSFGIILAEIAYTDKAFFHAKRDEILAIYIIKHNRRPKVPEGTPNCYRDLMERCWDSNKDKRPKVHKIKSILDQWRHNPPYSVLQEFRESDKLPKTLPTDEEAATNEPAHNAVPIHTKAINTAMGIETSVRNHDEFQRQSNLYTGTSIVDPGMTR
ncbi:12646_t:CDS:2 [Funneliformis geosporum]|uniref:15607_t:CDS:1 n=1 Tax=Funneliformis geosporum TaxID=1117311 RepID=A0A9W4WQN2_9GLOM|nr:15607_t:CDS:2 [Funneliformis geosporum]CAI2182815.1 12646_t:CDS:2 [Funneliformis geosporum]